MSAFIKTFKEGSYEHEQLRIAAEMLTNKSPENHVYYVGDTYFDFGQGWVWTTILCASDGGFGDYQAITPAQQEEIILSHDLDKTTDSLIYWKNVK